MNILFVYSSPIDYIKGGIQRVTYNLAKQFKKAGYEVFFLSFTEGIIERSDFPQFFVPNVKAVECDENISYLGGFIEKKGIDVVINQAGMSPAIFRVLSKTKKCKPFRLISCIHNSIFGGVENYDRTHISQLKKAHLLFLTPLFRKRWMKFLLCKLYILKNKQYYQQLCDTSDYVVVLTKAMLGEIIRMTGKEVTNIIQIPNGTTIPTINLSTQEKQKIFLYVGKIDYGYKRVDLLLNIWKMFSRNHLDYQLLIIGGGEMKTNIKRRVDKENIQNIQFEGWREATDYYQKAFGLLMTSCSEGLPMVLIEAMSYGVIPFVYDAFEHIHEIIDDGINGFLAPDEDVYKMVSIMDNVIDNSDLAKRVSQNAICKSYQFDSKKTAARWVELIQQ